MPDSDDTEENSERAASEIIPASPEFQEVLKSLPSEKRVIVESTITTIERRIHKGPLPAPEDFAKYNNIVPGAGERILAMAERNQAHRHAMEEREAAQTDAEIEIDKSDSANEFVLKTRGQWLAFGTLLLLVPLALYLAYLGDTSAAALIAGAAMVSIVAIFVTGRWIDHKSRTEEETDNF
jgi:uncharacterized membrane protein